MKLSNAEIAAAIIAGAGTEAKSIDGILSNFFKVLAVLKKTSEQEHFPEIVSYQESR
jgi:hypothetical protein